MPRVDVHLEPDALSTALRDDVVRGLTAYPKQLPPKWFYDERGSILFDEITRLDEYYPTRREREILAAHAMDVATLTRAHTLVELGSGTSEKTRILLDALSEGGSMRRFVPFDVSEQILRDAATSIESEYDGLAVHAVVGDFERHLDGVPSDEQRLVAFLGGTIGNFAPHERGRFLKELSATLELGDHLLIGFDLVKDVGRLEAAYNDAKGVTADFNRNVLRVINRELDANFDAEAFAHRAFFDTDESWIEMRLVSPRDHAVRIGELGLDVSFASGEEMRTEISAKFTRDRIAAELDAARLEVVELWTDAADDFALALAAVS